MSMLPVFIFIYYGGALGKCHTSTIIDYYFHFNVYGLTD